MNKEDLDAIASRSPYCRSFGESVSLSRVERDELVALARDGLNLASAAREALGFVSSAEQDYAPDGNLRKAEEILEMALVTFDAAMAKEGA